MIRELWYALLDLFEAVALWLLVPVALIILLCGVGLQLNRISCEQVQEQTGFDTLYRGISGCYIHVGDRYVPLGNWRVEQP